MRAGCVPDALAARGRTGRDSLCIFVFVFVFDVSLGVDGEGGFGAVAEFAYSVASHRIADGKTAPRMASRMAAEPPSMHAVCTQYARTQAASAIHPPSSTLINLAADANYPEPIRHPNSRPQFASRIEVKIAFKMCEKCQVWRMLS